MATVFILHNLTLNPCHAEHIKMSHSFMTVSQSDYLIQTVDINSNTK